MTNDPTGYITLAEAADRSKYSQEYLSLRARQGRLKGVKQGRNWVTTIAWLHEYLNSAEDAKRLLREATVVSHDPTPLKQMAKPDHLFEHHPAATVSLANKRTIAIPSLGGMAIQPTKTDSHPTGSRLLWTDEQPIGTSFFGEISDSGVDWSRADKAEKSAPRYNPFLLTEAVSVPELPQSTEPFWHEADALPVPVTVMPKVQPALQKIAVSPALPKPEKQPKQLRRLNLDGLFNALPGLATATAVVGISFMVSFGIGQLGIGTVSQAIAVGGMLVTGNEPALRWVAGDSQPRVVWGGTSALPEHALSQSYGKVAGASTDRSADKQSFSVTQSMAAGLFVISDSLNPNPNEYNGLSNWLIDAFDLPS